MSADTIRHYEKIGILAQAPRTPAGYRIYPANAVQRVRVVQHALSIGFSLAELADALRARDAGAAPCQRVYQTAKRKLTGIRAEIQALKRREKHVLRVLSGWNERMRRVSPGQRSELLDSLATSPALARSKTEIFRRRRKS